MTDILPAWFTPKRILINSLIIVGISDTILMVSAPFVRGVPWWPVVCMMGIYLVAGVGGAYLERGSLEAGP